MRPLIGITGRKDTSARLLNAPMHSVGETYTYAIHKMGGTPIILPPLFSADDWPVLLDRLDGLLLSGGEDIDPAHYGQETETWIGGVDSRRDAAELGLIPLLLKRGVPVLGICRGHQMLNVALGGDLYQDIAAYFPNALDHPYTPARPLEAIVHDVTIEPGSRLHAILGETEMPVNSAHHQAVKTPGRDMVVVAHAPDEVIEATEMPGHPFCLSVQWHPEAMVKSDDSMWPLFERFVKAATK